MGSRIDESTTTSDDSVRDSRVWDSWSQEPPLSDEDVQSRRPCDPWSGYIENWEHRDSCWCAVCCFQKCTHGLSSVDECLKCSWVESYHDGHQWLKKNDTFWNQPQIQFLPSHHHFRVFDADIASQVYLAYTGNRLAQMTNSFVTESFSEDFYQKLGVALNEHGWLCIVADIVLRLIWWLRAGNQKPFRTIRRRLEDIGTVCNRR
jgi:hypothetical protein